MKDREPKSTTPRGRGTYTPRACNFCRLRKIKCNGNAPVCEPCMTSGHDCTWGGDPANRPNTKQYVESLRNRIRILEAYVARCRQEHGILEGDSAPDLSARLDTSAIDGGDYNESSDDGEDNADNLRALVLDDQDLQFHGSTSIFQFAPPNAERKSRFPEIIENSSRCYVLILDGEDNSHYNPDFDWSRHLPPELPLDRREHDKLLDLLFKFFATWCLRIVPPLFLRDMFRSLSVPYSQTPPKTAHYSPMLHNALLALATAFSDDPRIRDLKTRNRFAQLAKSYVEKECQSPNISVVHALSILGSFHSAQGDNTLGYIYFGMSGRVSQALGLNIDCSPWVKAGLISHDDMLDRNWAHWTTFCQDVCWSLFVGREHCVSEADRRTIPVPFVDSDFDQIPWKYPPSGLPPQPSNFTRTFAEACELLGIGRHILEIVNLSDIPGSQEISIECISEIDVQLNTWREHLPPEVEITKATLPTATPHRLMVHLVYWHLIILLHRPFYRRPPRSNPDVEIDHVKFCNRAAENIMDLLGVWRKLYTLRYVPVTLVQVVSSAGTIFLLSAIQATSGVRFAQVSLQNSLSQAELCIRYLHEVGRSYPCARNVAGILFTLLQEQLQPKLATRFQDSSTNPMPDSQMSSTNHQIPPTSPAEPSRLNETPSGPPRLYIAPSDLPNQIPAQGDLYTQVNRVQYNSGWIPPVYPNIPTNVLPPLPDTGFGTLPIGLGTMGNDVLPHQALTPAEQIRYNQAYYRRQLGLPQENDPPAAVDLTDEDSVWLQHFLNRPFDNM